MGSIADVRQRVQGTCPKQPRLLLVAVEEPDGEQSIAYEKAVSFFVQETWRMQGPAPIDRIGDGVGEI